MAMWEQWLAKYEAAYLAVPDDLHAGCPNCGHDALRLVFTGSETTRVGWAAFWCDNCLQGIGISRAPIPDGAVMQDIHDAPENRQPKVPNYQLVA